MVLSGQIYGLAAAVLWKGTAQDGVEWTDLWSGSCSPVERVLDTQRIKGWMAPELIWIF